VLSRFVCKQHKHLRVISIHLFAMLALLFCVGCSSVKVHLGLRVSLPKIPVKAMDASLDGLPAMAPGEKTGLIVTFTGQNGQTLVSEGAGKGKVLWRDLAVTANVVAVDKKGNVTLPRDPRVSEGKTGHITVTIPSQPGLRADLDVPLRYNYAFTSHFYGSRGGAGFMGTNGTDGTPGMSGSLDPNNPAPGGDGGNGTDGGDGGVGGDGGDGPAVHVFVTLRPGSTPPMLQVGVVAPGHKERFYLIDPNGGSLTVTSEGGAGGPGGKGGRGGRGGSGGLGSPSGSNGLDGHDGHDGSDGQAGSNGSITVTYDPQVTPFLAAIIASSPGGPKPTFNAAPVAPLW
jgi:hypothetical protein